MLSIKDCLDYCDLTNEEVDILAEHEDMTDVAAAQLACGLVQTQEGTLVLTHYMMDLIDRAERRGDLAKAKYIRSVCAQFMADHPVRH
ncbi:MAG: hypothetical protein HGA47_12630 [Zoogloea sp.]|nr:hypothetical protein [Zoogloea sp.]